MILLREVQEKDLDALEKLAQIPGFINLPSEKELLREKIGRATISFKDNTTGKFDGKYIFVAEDVKTHRIYGTSMIAGQHGTVESPHFYFEVGSEEKFSETINTGFIHGTLKLKYDTNGPSEIGGLVIDPGYRNSEERMGRQISFVRFLFLSLNRSKFKRKILAELLPPLNKKGQSPLWEAIGRRFTNMDYWEADQLCQQNKEFIFSLFPSGKIYTTFLSAEAKNAIGKVGKETEPVLHMLKKIGFRYKNHIDPFDGGPHLWANVDEILPVKKVIQQPFEKQKEDFASNLDKRAASYEKESGLICKVKQKPGEFRAMAAQVYVKRSSEEKVPSRIDFSTSFPSEIQSMLGLNDGDLIAFMPYY